MLINSILLAISSSIDSLGIGITYGIKNTKISYVGTIILSLISFFVSLISLWFGNIIKYIFPVFLTNLLGSSILLFMGGFIIYQALKKDIKETIILPNNSSEEKVYSFFIKFLGITIKIIKNPISSDLDDSKTIDAKEALFLGLALSLDSFGIGICSSIIGINVFLFPILITIFQLLFLNIGNFFGIKLYKLSNLPNNIWSIISGVLLIFIGFVKFISL